MISPAAFREAEASHLLRRIAFGASQRQVEMAVSEGPLATVRRYLGDPGVVDSDADAVDHAVEGNSDRSLLAGAWLHRCLQTPWPLRERLVLFWHGHFVSALRKVQSGTMMIGQIRLFRRLGGDSFEALTQEVSRDPAMVRYLDSERSTRTAPNENFARELLELFTMGPGPYSEEDVQEAARAFTGYHLRGGRFHFSSAAHDSGPKRVLGMDGPLTGDDVVKAATRHPATAPFMGRRFATAFLADRPDGAGVDHVVDAWRRHRGHVRLILEDVLTHERFYDPVYRLALTRDPVSLMVGMLRTAGCSWSAEDLTHRAELMGQALLDPPSVKGFPSGGAWLNPATLLARRSFLVALAKSWSTTGSQRNLRDLARRLGLDGADRFPPSAGTPAQAAQVFCHPDAQRC